MKNKPSNNFFRFNFWVAIIIFSLIGLLFTQVFWIRNAVQLAETQFDHRVSLAMDEVVRELRDNIRDDASLIKSALTCQEKQLAILSMIDYDFLDSLMADRFAYYQVDSVFQYEVVNCYDNHVHNADDPDLKSGKDKKNHTAFFTCARLKECFHLEVHFPNKRKYALMSISLWMGLSFAFLLILLYGFYFIVNTVFTQKKISQIKNDFINNMTHELKTPISTISMASEVISSIGMDSENDRLNKYIRIIHEENNRLSDHVEKVLEIALLDSGDIDLNPEEIEVNELIEDICEPYLFEECTENLSIELQLNAKEPHVYVDRMHLINVITNLLDNARKYSNGKAEIQIRTVDLPHKLLIEVSDKGIGMSAETLKHVFEKFYRRPTGNRHDTKGFGLGLYYVQTILKSMGGEIKVKSELNKGSQFFVYLPKN